MVDHDAPGYDPTDRSCLVRPNARVTSVASLSGPSMSKHLGAGFKLFCSHYRSISGVYRQLVINRVQFDKYLSDQS